MGSTRASVSKEFPLSLPSGELPDGVEAISIRKLRARDQSVAAQRFNPEKQAARYGTELYRQCVVRKGSCTEECPDGVPAFSDEGILDMLMEDSDYLTEACMRLNKMGKNAAEYKFDF